MKPQRQHRAATNRPHEEDDAADVAEARKAAARIHDVPLIKVRSADPPALASIHVTSRPHTASMGLMPVAMDATGAQN